MTNQILCGDARLICSHLPKDIIDLTMTSPPYNVGKEYDVHWDAMPADEYFDMIEIVLKEVYRATKRGGRLCLNVPFVGNSYFQAKSQHLLFYPLKYTEICQTMGWILRDFFVWAKGNESQPAVAVGNATAWGSWCSPSNPFSRCFAEAILVFHKEIPEHYRYPELGKTTEVSDLTPKEFMAYTKSTWLILPKHDKAHPCIYPAELPSRCIKLFTWIDDVILDPFCGIGTTCLAARKLNRQFIGIDISEAYCKIARQLVSEWQQPLF